MMGMENPSTPPADIAADFDQKARNYEHSPIQHTILNPYKNSILILRAKYATYETITTMLTDSGVKVSEATVRKFCRTHQAEMKRLRTEIDRRRREPVGAAASNFSGPQASEAPPSEASRPTPAAESAKAGFTSKPGPKIARENL
jgi:hypothetical protein